MGHVDGPCRALGMCEGPVRRSAGKTPPLTHGQASPVEYLILSLGSHPLNTLQPPSLQPMTQRSKPLQRDQRGRKRRIHHGDSKLHQCSCSNRIQRKRKCKSICSNGSSWTLPLPLCYTSKALKEESTLKKALEHQKRL